MRCVAMATILVAFGASAGGCGARSDRSPRAPTFVISPEGVLPIWDSNRDGVVITATMDVSELVRPVDPSIVERRLREGEAIRAKTPHPLHRQIPRDFYGLEPPMQSMEDLVARFRHPSVCSAVLEGGTVDPVGEFRLQIRGTGLYVGEAVRCVLREMQRRREYESDVPTWIFDLGP